MTTASYSACPRIVIAIVIGTIVLYFVKAVMLAAIRRASSQQHRKQPQPQRFGNSFPHENTAHGNRMLHYFARARFDVPLFLELQFVDESLALDFETLDETNPNIVHFCRSIQTQILGSTVTKAAREYNTTIVDELAGSGCNLVDAQKVCHHNSDSDETQALDNEAGDVFGSGYCSLRVHVKQRVVVESSNPTLYLEVVQKVIEEGFGVASGGQREFRNSLYENPAFSSVVSVQVRRGLQAPNNNPTPSPRTPTTAAAVVTSPSPTQKPTQRPTRRPTQKPTRRPTRNPTRNPTPRPTPIPTRRPTSSPTNIPTTAPSSGPSERPSMVPSRNPSAVPSRVPSSRPSQNPTSLPSTSPSLYPSQPPSERPTLQVRRDSAQSVFNNEPSAVAGGVLGFLIACLLFLIWLFWCRYRKNAKYRFWTEKPLNHYEDKHLDHVPGFVEVELNARDHHSLEDTTLGGSVVGGRAYYRQKQYHRRGQPPPPPSRLVGNSSSFDENSLFTTPFDEPEQRAMVLPPHSSQSSSKQSSLMTPLDYEERVVFPPSSGSVSEEETARLEEGIEFPLTNASLKALRARINTFATGINTVSTATNTSVPIDTDSGEAYFVGGGGGNEDHLKITKIEPLRSSSSFCSSNNNNNTSSSPKSSTTNSRPSNYSQNSDFTRIPSDLDVWSCDFEDFDKGSEFYKAAEEDSKSPSLSSSASTHRINNVVVPSKSLLGRPKEDESPPLPPPPSPPPPPKLKKAEAPAADVVSKPVQTVPKPVKTDDDREKDVILSPPVIGARNSNKNGIRKFPHASAAALRWKIATTNSSSTHSVPKPSTSKENQKPSSNDEEGSRASKKTTLSELSKDTKTGAPTTTIDCLSDGIVSSLKDGVNSLKDGAPKIDRLGNGIVNTLKDGAPHIESIGNGLVSSLTDIFDRMAIPKITPEESESYNSESTNSWRNRKPKPKPKPKPISKPRPTPKKTLGAAPKTVSDDDSGMSASPWLMEKVENTLGPRSVHADMASLNSHKTRSPSKPRSVGRRKKNGSEVSYGSRNSSHYGRFSSSDVASIMSKASKSMSNDVLANQTPEEISFPSRSTLEDGIKRLELQLAELDQKEKEDAASSVTMSSVTFGSFSTISARSKTNRNRRKVLVIVPPGRLGVILADQHDGNGTVITSIRKDSPVTGILKPGDKLIAIDEIAVVNMTCSQITSLIASRADHERRFTVMTTVIKQNDAFEPTTPGRNELRA